MKNNYFITLILVFLFAAPTLINAQSQAKNTQVVSICGCPGAVWDLSIPYSPSISFSVAGQSKRVMFNSYGFNIPSTATITGIKVDFIYSMNNTSNNTLKDTLVYLMSPNLVTVEDKSPSTGFLNGTSGALTYGGPTDLWGITWTPADVNSTAFGLNFKLETSAAPADFTFTNGATIVVYYNLANGISESQKASPGIKAFINNRKLHIETISQEEISVEIFALTGRKVLSTTIENNSDKSVDLSELSKGVYLYNIKTGNGTKVAKFLID